MGREYLEGRRALAEALSAKTPVERVWAGAAASKDKTVAKLLERARKKGAQIVPATAEQLDAHSSHGAHQGVIASVAPYAYATLPDLVARAKGQDNALVVACDHITDAGNLGAIARSAEVVGATGLLLPNRRSARVTAATYKTSAGAVAHLPIAMEANLARSLGFLKDEGFWIIGASERARTCAWDAPLSGRVALVVGSEGKGLASLVEKTCDLLVSLPQKGKVGSLNVAQAATVLAYEWMRQCSAGSPS
jgi:23S rRNA (guanosine2251-2'-O)-methyltransferase